MKSKSQIRPAATGDHDLSDDVGWTVMRFRPRNGMAGQGSDSVAANHRQLLLSARRG